MRVGLRLHLVDELTELPLEVLVKLAVVVVLEHHNICAAQLSESIERACQPGHFVEINAAVLDDRPEFSDMAAAGVIERLVFDSRHAEGVGRITGAQQTRRELYPVEA